MFLLVQADKDKGGQTISHFIGIWARKVNYHRGKWTFIVRGYRTCEESKELEHSQEVSRECHSYRWSKPQEALRRIQQPASKSQARTAKEHQVNKEHEVKRNSALLLKCLPTPSGRPRRGRESLEGEIKEVRTELDGKRRTMNWMF